MQNSNLLIVSLFVAILVVLCLYHTALEWFKLNRARQHDPAFAEYKPTQYHRRVLASANAIVVLLLFYLGFQFLPLAQHPLSFVLYWWGTFSLALCLFLYPTLDFLFQTQRKDEHAKEQKQVIVQMIHHVDEILKAQPPGTFPGPAGEDPFKPPTIH